MNITKEIVIDEQKTDEHFSKIASKYKNLRTTDSDHIQHIINQLSKKSGITMADIGCGDGRYSIELLRRLEDDCYLHCIDYNENMIKYLKSYLIDNSILNFCARPGDASKLPLESNSMDCIVTFNAIHHFDVPKFLSESLRSLKDEGHLFIYTRLQNQNSKSIWGEHFPLFADIETRLYKIEKLKQHIQEADMQIHSTKVFGYDRTSSLSRLVSQAENNHYSTFALYSSDTFEKSLETFQQNIRDNFDDLENIKWQDENILLEITK